MFGCSEGTMIEATKYLKAPLVILHLRPDPPPRPVKENVSLHSKSLCKNIAPAVGVK